MSRKPKPGPQELLDTLSTLSARISKLEKRLDTYSARLSTLSLYTRVTFHQLCAVEMNLCSTNLSCADEGLTLESADYAKLSRSFPHAAYFRWLAQNRRELHIARDSLRLIMDGTERMAYWDDGLEEGYDE